MAASLINWYLLAEDDGVILVEPVLRATARSSSRVLPSSVETSTTFEQSYGAGISVGYAGLEAASRTP